MSGKRKYKKERKQVAAFMSRLYKQRLTTTSGGNISLKLNDDVVLITPSATDKGKMNWKEVGIVSLSGRRTNSRIKLSMETGMHLAIYRKKKEIKAIIHAHPVYASSFTAMDCPVDTTLTAEAAAILGTPCKVPYALMGTDELAMNAAEHIKNSEILLLENHGVLTAGKDLLQAFDRIEVLENAAKMTVITEVMKKKRPLDDGRLNEIKKIFRC